MLNPGQAYNETYSRGTLDFPFDYHFIDLHHPRFVMPYHYHIDQELLRVLRGGVSLTLNERQYHLKEGEYLIISDGVVHGGQPDDENTVYECVVFNLMQLFDIERPDLSWLKKIFTHQIVINEYFTMAEHPEIAVMAASFIESAADQVGRNALLTTGQLLSLLGIIIARHHFMSYQQTMSSNYLRHLHKSQQLFKFIFDNFSKDITLDDMARSVELSPKYFCKFFRELTGNRPMEYLNKFRIDCAALKLTSGNENINEIGYSCGFRDPCYFNKLFRRYFGVSPGQYRINHLQTVHQP